MGGLLARLKSGVARRLGRTEPETPAPASTAARPAPAAPPKPLSLRPDNLGRNPRATVLYRFLDQFDLPDKTGVEIGPFDRPVLQRDKVPGVLYSDVKDYETLYDMADRAVTRNAADVVRPDFVTLDEQLWEMVEPGSMDFVFASHVMEHLPDLIGSLKGFAQMLKPGGLLLFAYPDRRYMYDIDRPATTLEQLRRRHAEGHTRPAPEIVHEHFSLVRHVNTGLLWQGDAAAIGARKHEPHRAERMAKRARHEYIDVHCNIFTDDEFMAMIAALKDEVPFKKAGFAPTRAPFLEFLGALRKPV